MAVWLVTGAAGGFGAAITRAALDRGHTVVATARRPDPISAALPGYGRRLLPVTLDVTDPDQASSAVAVAMAAYGRIDVLVNNAGRGLFGAIEETSAAEAKAVFDTNVFGLLAMTRAVLPVFRAQRDGHVLMMSSMGGFSSGAGFGVYAASKFAVEGLAEALHEELAPLGVRVTIVEPGVFDTDFGRAGSPRAVARIPDYHPTGDLIEQYLPHPNSAASPNAAIGADSAAGVDPAAGAGAVAGAGAGVGAVAGADSGAGARAAAADKPGDPAEAAAEIVRVADLPNPPLRLPLGADAIGRIRHKLATVTAELDARDRR